MIFHIGDIIGDSPTSARASPDRRTDVLCQQEFQIESHNICNANSKKNAQVCKDSASVAHMSVLMLIPCGNNLEQHKLQLCGRTQFTLL